MDPQSRKYQLTINNPIPKGYTSDVIKDSLQALSLDYYCYAFEKGSQDHVHSFLYSHSPIRFSTLKSRFNEAHIEKAYGTIQQNRDYILKAGKWEDTEKASTSIKGSFFESGEPPNEESQRANLMASVQEELRSGIPVMQIIKKYPSLSFRINDLYSLRDQLLAEKYETENRKLEVIYCYGSTGTGKTSSIYKDNPGERICRITSYDNVRALFDNYHGERILVFEEFHSQISLTDMLCYLDIYPLTLPARYSNRIACFEKVYVISNLPINQQYTTEQRNDPKTYAAFLRRFSSIRAYRPDFTYLEEPKENNTWQQATDSPFTTIQSKD